MMGYGTVLIETAGLGFVEASSVPRAWYGWLNVGSARRHHSGPPPTSTRAAAQPGHRLTVPLPRRRDDWHWILVALGMSCFGPLKWALLAILPIAWVGAWLDWAKQGWLVTDNAIADAASSTDAPTS